MKPARNAFSVSVRVWLSLFSNRASMDLLIAAASGDYFTLLSDETKEVIKMFGVNGPLGFWVQRVTFLVDQNRYIKGRVKAHFSIAEHEAFIRKAIEIAKLPD